MTEKWCHDVCSFPDGFRLPRNPPLEGSPPPSLRAWRTATRTGEVRSHLHFPGISFKSAFRIQSPLSLLQHSSNRSAPSNTQFGWFIGTPLLILLFAYLSISILPGCLESSNVQNLTPHGPSFKSPKLRPLPIQIALRSCWPPSASLRVTRQDWAVRGGCRSLRLGHSLSQSVRVIPRQAFPFSRRAKPST